MTLITESKLQTWSSAPSPTEMMRIQHTQELIKSVLKQNLAVDQIKKDFGLESFNYEVYLQGSYANHTNVKFDSDVDIVVQLKSTHFSDKSQLPDEEKILYDLNHSNSKYHFVDFKNHVFVALQKSFGGDVEYAPKCLKIHQNTSRVNADVVPALEYRKYKRFLSLTNEVFVEGIKLFNTDDNSEIINYPKKHLENCESKNTDTDGMFKSMVRILKNMRNVLIDQKKINQKLAPSYFIENLVYNCSSSCFDSDYSRNLINILQFVFDAIELNRAIGFVCANDQDNLISPTTWNIPDINSFVSEIVSFYTHPENYGNY